MSRPGMPPLALLTRPRAEAEALAAALAARGVAAQIEPVIEIIDCAAEPPDLRGVQALLCTSANGVRAVARLTAERRLPLFAVGEASAAAARRAGFAAVESAAGDVADLARLVAARLDRQRGRILHAAGSTVSGDLAGLLAPEGFVVERAVLYEARPVPALSPQAIAALASGRIDLALFFSPRSAAIFIDLAAAAGLAEVFGGITALSISAAADRPLGRFTWRERIIAARPNQASLLGALDRVIGAADVMAGAPQ